VNTYTPEDEILARARADWVHFAEALWLIDKWSSKRGLDTRQELIRVFRSLISEGFIEVGDVSKEAGFRSWNLPEGEVIGRVLSEWDSLARAPLPGDVCWLANTREGDRRADELLSHPDPAKKWISDRT
jgi:hypothetical protein